ncbi:unnamed protein product [Linum trigynum]|uniref:ADP-ribosyl cyclase/cyclic ADP-ribose hydrolase n=1 Tax=Linum trigynum TaxID=586398 RepID=A0AAV2DIB1_9ROSI
MGGGEISPGLVRAMIGESKIYVPIFSEHYACSRWCLEELAQMVECWKRGKGGHLFLPIFYYVEPRDVRHQQGPYKQAFEQLAQKHSPQIISEWKEALQEVGKMRGWYIHRFNRQGAMIDQIVSAVALHLKSSRQ